MSRVSATMCAATRSLSFWSVMLVASSFLGLLQSSVLASDMTTEWFDEQLAMTAPAAIYPGDFNQDGAVNFDDFDIWRAGSANLDDYALWRANFGKSTTSGSETSSSGSIADASLRDVPEPGTLALLAAALFGLFARARRRRADE